jgi:DNA-binding response OmpR family regulator
MLDGGLNSMTAKVLLVEELIQTAHSLVNLLQAQECDVTIADSPSKVSHYLTVDWPDCIILNLASSTNDGLAYCDAIDSSHLKVPRLIVDSNEDSCRLPATDFLLIPFSPRQFISKLNNIANSQPPRFLRKGYLTLDDVKRRALIAGKPFNLTPKEFQLLKMLLQNEGVVVSRETIMKTIWETDYLGDTRTLDVHVRWLREKIEENPAKPQHLITVRGIGYRFNSMAAV